MNTPAGLSVDQIISRFSESLTREIGTSAEICQSIERATEQLRAELGLGASTLPTTAPKAARRLLPTLVEESNPDHLGWKSVFAQATADDVPSVDPSAFETLPGQSQYVSDSDSDSDSGISVEIAYVSRERNPYKQRTAYQQFQRDLKDLESRSQQERLDYWRFIRDWKARKEEVLPPVNEWEIESDDGSAYLQELELQDKDLKISSKFLSIEEVAQIVDEAVEELIMTWRKKKLPIRQRRACDLWLRYPGSYLRRQFALVARAHASDLGNRLEKLKTTLVEEQWKKESKLRKQCQSLEMTVFQREDKLWEATTLEMQTEPPAIESKPSTRKKRQQNLDESDSEGIDVDSESEIASDLSDHGESVFMDIDNAEGVDINSVKQVRDRVEEVDMTLWPDPETDGESRSIYPVSSDGERSTRRRSMTDRRTTSPDNDSDNISELSAADTADFPAPDYANMDWSAIRGDPRDDGNSRKKRKRAVKPSTNVKRHQSDAVRRALEDEERARQNISQLEDSHGLLGHAKGEGSHVINPGKEEGQDYIYINAHAGRQLLEHQLEGLRFMWREIVTEMDTSKMSGCLLSHTMGLGKTMQTITLLVTIAEAAASSAKGTKGQVPLCLSRSKTLILCPTSLIRNWLREFEKWTPPQSKTLLGNIVSITSEMPTTDRVHTLNTWDTNGGVLVLGYDLFTRWLSNAGQRVKAHFLPGELEAITTTLLAGPNLIVADEAHTLKNLKAAVTMTAARFRSLSRIALTGSPLSNSLQEYFAMINWVSPGYLGHPLEFKAKYQEPINEGSYADSTKSERRKAIVRLKALEKVLEPKVNRKDGAVLRSTLQPKMEFEIKFALTDEQKQNYKDYLKCFFPNSADTAEVSNAGMWAHQDNLILLCNHPGALRAKLQKLKDESKVGGLNTMTLPIIDSLLLTIREGVDATVSHKTSVFMQIVIRSITQGDKVLLFSQSLDTLDYLCLILIKSNIKYSRLDGSVKMPDRQNMIDRFNSCPNSPPVMLISTKAGGQGNNLQAANRVIIFDFDFNPAWEEQAIGRAYRMGQSKPVYVYRFVADGTIESAMQNVTNFKTQLAIRVLERKNAESVAMRARDFLSIPKELKLSRDPRKLCHVEGRDAVLDHILQLHLREGPFISSICTTDVYWREREDELTAEDHKEIADMVIKEQKGGRGPQGRRSSNPGAQGLAASLPKAQTVAEHASAAPRFPKPPAGLLVAPVDTRPEPRLTEPAQSNLNPASDPENMKDTEIKDTEMKDTEMQDTEMKD